MHARPDFSHARPDSSHARVPGLSRRLARLLEGTRELLVVSRGSRACPLWGDGVCGPPFLAGWAGVDGLKLSGAFRVAGQRHTL